MVYDTKAQPKTKQESNSTALIETFIYKKGAPALNTTKKQINSIQNRKGLRWFFLIVLLAAELICNTWVRSESNQAMIMIAKEQAQIRNMANYRQALSVELERLKSEARIARIASTRLGLTSDIFNQTFYLPKGTN